jgi:ArsR family transcriptional regulator
MVEGGQMDELYEQTAEFCKALSDKSRLMILDMLSCGELCACNILEKFNITQPTLSHHMKTLCECGLVIGRKDGKWMYYSLNKATIKQFKEFIKSITTKKEHCICDGVDGCIENGGTSNG